MLAIFFCIFHIVDTTWFHKLPLVKLFSIAIEPQFLYPGNKIMSFYEVVLKAKWDDSVKYITQSAYHVTNIS